jgi:apolipoprotein N-acyltransferase
MRQYGSIVPLTAAAILGLLTVVFALFTAAFSFGVALAAGKGPSMKGAARACLLAPFLWVALEYTRAHLPIISFPWNLTGYVAGGNLALVQLVTLTGIYGLSFLIVGFNALVAYAYMSGRQRVWKATLVAAAILILIATTGGYLIPQAVPHHVAHLVQTNFPQSESYPADWLEIHAGELDQLEDLSVSSAEKATGLPGVPSLPSLIVWPEVPAPFSFQEPVFQQRAVRIARDSGSYFLVGIVDWKRDPAGKWLASNSAVLLDPQGQRIFTYDKIHLVPFGEYVPLRNWLTFAGRLTADISDFTPGSVSGVGKVPGGSFGVFICYEAIFASEVRRFTVNGAELLINTSNDGWFGRSSAPTQHLMMARVRAVESRRWLLRDTNNGFTVAVDPYGRIVAGLPTDVRAELDAPYDFRRDLTLYARWGDWFAWLCVLATFALLGYGIKNRGRRAAPAARV